VVCLNNYYSIFSCGDCAGHAICHLPSKFNSDSLIGTSILSDFLHDPTI
jgi:hypothetical protein